MGKIITAMCLCLLSAALVHADPAQDVFKQANDAYAQGQFSKAVSLYESVRHQGINAWVLHYDLGNAYYKSGAVGKAIASYLRAFKLKSNQRDVIYNLDLVSTRVGDPFVPNEALAGLFWRAFYSLTLDVLSLGVSLFFIAACIWGMGVFLRRWRFHAEMASGLVGVLLIMGLWWGLRVWLAEKSQAVIVAGTAEIRSGPNLTYPANFTVPEGRRVLILEEQEPIKGWIEIGVPKEGLKGWVPDTSVEAV